MSAAKRSSAPNSSVEIVLFRGAVHRNKLWESEDIVLAFLDNRAVIILCAILAARSDVHTGGEDDPNLAIERNRQSERTDKLTECSKVVRDGDHDAFDQPEQCEMFKVLKPSSASDKLDRFIVLV